MTQVTRIIVLGVTAASFAFAAVTTVSALDAGVYLDASLPGTSTLEELDSSLLLKGEATSSYSDTETSSSAKGASTSFSESFSLSRLWTMFAGFFGDGLTFEATTTSSSPEIESSPTFTNVGVKNVSARQATVSWSSGMFQNVKVYYATSTPVVLASSTANVPASRFWRRNEVKLRNLAPSTTYFYRVAAQTDLGTTTTSEASFRTTEKEIEYLPTLTR